MIAAVGIKMMDRESKNEVVIALKPFDQSIRDWDMFCLLWPSLGITPSTVCYPKW